MSSQVAGEVLKISPGQILLQIQADQYTQPPWAITSSWQRALRCSRSFPHPVLKFRLSL